MSHFVITTEQRSDVGLPLFMVDRNKQRKSFWSDRLDDVMLFTAEGAKKAVAKLRFNNPRVITLDHARRLARSNERIRDDIQRERDHQAALADCEMGWDAHKDVGF